MHSAGSRFASAALLACVLSGGVLSGCAAKRTLTITSTPPGATVRLDDEIVGVTPLRLPFNHYGTRLITFYKRGYLTEALLLRTAPPWYGRFPLDIVSEVLIPVGWRDDERAHADLIAGDQELPQPTLRSVIERAESLRRAGPNGPRNLPPSRTLDGDALDDGAVPPPPPGLGPTSPVATETQP